MNSATKEKIKRLYAFEKELALLDQIEAVLSWDQYTLMPDGASSQRADQLGYLSVLAHDKMLDKGFVKLISELKKQDIPSKEKRIVELRAEGIKECKKLPAEFVEESEIAAAEGYDAWLKAREKNDFKVFEPNLKKLIDLTIKHAEYLGRDVYDQCLYDYEEGSIDLPQLESVLDELKDGLIEIISKVKESKEYKFGKFFAPKGCSEEHQQRLVKYILGLMGIDPKRSVIGKTVHPFMSTMSFDDKRIAMAYKKEDFMFAFTSATHEGGHLLYELGFDKEYENTCLHDAPSMAMHESQSRLWENQIGLSYELWEHLFPDLSVFLPIKLPKTLDRFHAYINRLNASPVRLEADELHYCLHIIIRFEIEKDLLSRKLKTEDLPKAWADKYKQYIGVTPKDDKQGVLQDSHWSSGSFGYFPTYALGNVYSGMFWNQLLKENKGISREIANGNLSSARSWLNKNIYKHAARYPADVLLKKVCKESVTPKYYLDYLSNKYYALYGL